MINYETNKNIYGDALYETSATGEDSISWFSDNIYMPRGAATFFPRGGSHTGGVKAGMFSLLTDGGNSSGDKSRRTTLFATS